mmetsp:Transcript_46205/g.100411  ORF Transcript_46205/g.100411 Transcript_46205/m.100411 type:complete len:287 (-) Transcript_46205:72-932(-)
MSVTGFMYNINATKKLAEIELKEGYEGNRSWHHKYKDSAYVYVGGLHAGLTEGDVVIVFSQFGEIVDVNMVRDKATGKSKGFAFICYEDQRSTILAVDNMNGYQLLKRTLRVDHVEKYKAPKEFDENEVDADGDPKLLEYKATGAEGAGHEVFNVIAGQKQIAEIAGQRRERTSFKAEDEDEAWAKAFEQTIKSDKELAKEKRMKLMMKQEKKELKMVRKEAKKLKKEAKKAKKAAKEAKKFKSKKEKDKKGSKEVASSRQRTGSGKRKSSDSSESSADSSGSEDS